MINTEKTSKFYTDGSLTVRIKPGEEIPDGFRPGRTFNSKPWNKGLTKDTDDRVRLNGEKTAATRHDNGSYENPWNKGLTKEIDHRVANVSKKVSAARQDKFWTSTAGVAKTPEQKLKQSQAMKGKDPWNKGLTKETDERILKTADKLLGHKCFVTDWDKAKEKEYLTKKMRNSFNTSKPEIELLNDLQSKYGEDNVVNQYQDTRYKNPKTGRSYNCDFYVKSLDLFIELNMHWTHGGHPFDENDPSDLETLCDWQLKSALSKYSYNSAIYTWTESDPTKLSVLRANNLNFMIIYPKGLVIDK